MSLVLELTRTYYRGISALSPQLAASRASKLFLTPLPRKPGSRWPAKLAGQAEPFELTFAGESLAAWTFGAGERVVVLVHGWGGVATDFQAFIDPLVAADFTVLAFDGPAHGRSRARRTNMVEFSRLLRALSEQLGGRLHGLVGHSFGGAAVTYAASRGLDLAAIVLVSPFTDSDRNIDDFARALKLSPEVRELTRGRLREFFAHDLDGWNLKTVAGKIAARTLVIHDADDKEIPLSESEVLTAGWPSAELWPTTGLGHRRILRDEAVARRVTEFLSGGPTNG